MQIVPHHADGRYDWLISEQQSVNPSREAISILFGKYKRFTFLHSVDMNQYLFMLVANFRNLNIQIISQSNDSSLCKRVFFFSSQS